MLTRSVVNSRAHVGQIWKLLLNLGCLACSIIAHQFYEFKILQSDKVAGINRNNDFQAYFAGLAVSLQNVRGWQKTQETAFSFVCFIFVGRRSLNWSENLLLNLTSQMLFSTRPF